MQEMPVRVLVAGSYVIDDGYPNVKWLLRAMEEDGRFSMAYAGGGHEKRQHFSTEAGSVLKLVGQGLRTMFRACREVIVVLKRKKFGPAFDVLFVPYPSLPILLLLSLLPRQYRPRIVADAFISIYDTVVNDRKMLDERSFLASLLRRVEKRTLHAANVVLTDTECNRRFLEQIFLLPADRVQALPLATDEHHYLPVPYDAVDGDCTVLFVGTFVPLHGVETIARAMLLLEKEPGIRFRVFGNGQAADVMNEVLRNGECKLEWRREWVGPENLAREVENADICLGIFGTTAKAARVWPLKNYTAMRIGRAIVSESTECMPGLGSKKGELPVCMVPAGDAGALADALLCLARNPGERVRMADAARCHYRDHMSNEKVLDGLYRVMCGLADQSGI
jgi:glycosyltransferase involved in cell wall biosynthesis